MNQNPQDHAGGIIATMTTLGLRLWEKLLYRVIVILPILVVLQVFLIVGLTEFGLITPHLADISSPQLLVILFCSTSLTLLAILGALRLIHRQKIAAHNGHFLKMAIPLSVEDKCIIFQHGHNFLGLGYIRLPQEWSDTSYNVILKAIAQLEHSVTLQIVRTYGGQIFRVLIVRHLSEDLNELANQIVKSCQSLQETLAENGVQTEWVKDKLGIEQLYWLCILGKGFGDDVLLQCEENLVVAKISDEKPRLLVSLNLLQSQHMIMPQNKPPIEALDIIQKNRPFLLSFSLNPITPELVAKMLRQTAVEAPELSLLVEALGETIALQVYSESNSTTIHEITTLLAGRKEGLWQYNFRLICQLVDAPILTDNLETSPQLLGCRGFTEIAICHQTNHQWINTNRLLKILVAGQTSQERKSNNSSNG